MYYRNKHDFKGMSVYCFLILYQELEAYTITPASTKRVIGDTQIFNDSWGLLGGRINYKTREEWEEAWDGMYDQVIDSKYHKTKRNFTQKLSGKPHPGNDLPPLYLIPRERGGPSYKNIKLDGAKVRNIMFMLISKGFGMQGISSFSMGPFYNEGLCLVNTAFSKAVCLFHLVGGGKVDLKKKYFWRSGKAIRKIKKLSETKMEVDGKIFHIKKWLEDNKEIWLEEYTKWARSVALCSRGDFNWDQGQAIIYYDNQSYLNFTTWKKECYIRPAYDYLPQTREFKFIMKCWYTERRALGLVHPMAKSDIPEKPITRQVIRKLFDSEYEMCCMPYVIAGRILNVPINKSEHVDSLVEGEDY
jgi:hypothetical protein